MRIYIRILKESILFALGALVANKLRTLLSLFGVVIGIFSIILVFTAVDSLEKNVENSFQTLGSDVIYVAKWPWQGMGPNYEWWKYWQRPNPKVEEFQSLMESSNYAEAAAFRASVNKTVSFEDVNLENINISGVSYDFYKVRNLEFDEGRYFSSNEDAQGSNVAVIGYGVMAFLFEKGFPIGKEIKVLGQKYEVIGVLAKEGDGLLGGFQDFSILIPFNNFRRFVNIYNFNLNTEIIVKAKPGILKEQLSDELTGIIRNLRRLSPLDEDNFALNEADMLTRQSKQIFVVLNIVGWIIGLFAILIGAFGIANIMFVSVKERTSIIGVQKALGAKNSFILIQFLTEAVVLAIFGGLIGLFLIYLTTVVSNNLIGFELNLTPDNTIRGILIAAITGVLSGAIPAYQASRLSPVEAIRAN